MIDLFEFVNHNLGLGHHLDARVDGTYKITAHVVEDFNWSFEMTQQNLDNQDYWDSFYDALDSIEVEFDVDSENIQKLYDLSFQLQVGTIQEQKGKMHWFLLTTALRLNK